MQLSQRPRGRRLSAKYGIWAKPWMRPRSWDEVAAQLAIEITAMETKKKKEKYKKLAALPKRSRKKKLASIDDLKRIVH